jgi:XTP/dITP diphosphohydrolase
MNQLIFASNNASKLAEVRELLSGLNVISLAETGFKGELPETSGTIRGNAIQKAEYLNQQTGLDCFSDDTGLEVEALGGLPGVNTAFYAGPTRDSMKNMQKLLAAMGGCENRRARFITVMALVYQGQLLVFEGMVNGVISDQIKGSGGFGYDPVFIPEGYQQTFGELPSAIKQAISHRARALRQLFAWFEKTLAHKG